MMPKPAVATDLDAVVGDRYRLVEELGRGGSAVVYRAEDRTTGRQVALKRLRADNPARHLRQVPLFEREYRALAQLSHPSVIRVFEYGVDEGGAFYTMELLEGEPLVDAAPLPWRDAARALRDLASALSMLHARRWLHRDLSPANVMLTADGIAKLIDFGALAPMGVARALIGTPPIVPPEAVQQQSLDARADLYCLGALGYFLLTGRHAFPARTFEDLRDLWRSVPRPIERLAPEAPTALNQLLMDLLNLDRFARPAAAAAVIERLDGLLGHSLRARAHQSAAGRAYLAVPRLHGRDAQLAAIRERMVHALRGRGSAVLIEGGAGSGRSRLLDACVLEARLVGALVLRAGAGDAGGSHSISALLGEQLVALAPQLSRSAARLRGDLLAQIVPSLETADVASAAPTSAQAAAVAHGPEQRRHLQTALRDWFRTVARKRRIVIAVDDADHIDEPSLALLSALAHRSERRKLVLICTVEDATPSSPALSLLRDVALRVDLPPLLAEDTEALLESLFGSHGNAALLAPRIHALSGGNPGAIMALAEHLVERGIARYGAGSWSLPERIEDSDLPASVEHAIGASRDALEPAARTLAELLSLTDPRCLSLSQYAALCEPDGAARVFTHLQTLVGASVLVADGDRYRFAHSTWQRVLREGISPERARAYHERLAALLEAADDPVRTAHHLLHSDQGLRAATLLRETPLDPLLDRADAFHVVHGAVERAGDAMTPRDSLELRLRLLAVCGIHGRLEVFKEHAGRVVSELEEACGLDLVGELDPALDPKQRATEALERAQARHDAREAPDRHMPPLEALGRLGQLSVDFAGMAAAAIDPSIARRFPSTAPLLPLLPIMELTELHMQACEDHLAGRWRRAERAYAKLLDALDGELGAMLPPHRRLRARLSTSYALGVMEAMNGLARALDRAHELEQRPGYRVNAWRIRMLYAATLGDLEQAQRCERRAQLLLLQDGERPFPTTDQMAELQTRILSDDLEGLRHMEPRLREAAQRFPLRATFVELARCHYTRIKGDPEAALSGLQPLLERQSPEHTPRFAWTGATHLMLLVELGRIAEAVRAGRHYLESSLARGLELLDCAPMVRPLALALAHHGEHGEAVELAEELVEQLRSVGADGMALGACCEARARVAIIGRDSHGFDRWAEHCGRAYLRTHNSAAAAKLATLLRDARSVGVGTHECIEAAPSAADELPLEPQRDATVMSMMLECVGPAERAGRALGLLIDQGAADSGFLYGWLSGQLTVLAAIPEHAPPDGLDGWVSEYLQHELRPAITTARGNETVSEHPPVATAPRFASHRPVLLATSRDGEPTVAGVVVLVGDAQAPRVPSRQLCETLACSLLEHDDVDPVARPD